jgi:transposase InsO family protein
MEFVARRKAGERIGDLCREFQISRKTGHKIWNRYRDIGIEGLLDASRAPKRIPHRTPEEIVQLVVAERTKHPTWGARKLKHVIEQTMSIALPSSWTIAKILKQRGLIETRPHRKHAQPRPTKLRTTSAVNEVWCADYKGQFRMADGRYCYPLTVSDHASRFILCCEGMHAISDSAARESFIALFRERGLPIAIRSDNGVPFASSGLATLTRLSVLWLRLGIELERIEPGHPEQNGRHERMHRTLKKETTRPAGANLLQQQERFDAFVDAFNMERPHEALDMKRPGDVYIASERRLPSKLATPSYPLHDDAIDVMSNGQIKLLRQRGAVHLATALAGELVGLREEDDGRYLISFMHIDLGHVSADGRSFVPMSA